MQDQETSRSSLRLLVLWFVLPLLLLLLATGLGLDRRLAAWVAGLW